MRRAAPASRRERADHRAERCERAVDRTGLAQLNAADRCCASSLGSFGSGQVYKVDLAHALDHARPRRRARGRRRVLVSVGVDGLALRQPDREDGMRS